MSSCCARRASSAMRFPTSTEWIADEAFWRAAKTISFDGVRVDSHETVSEKCKTGPSLGFVGADARDVGLRSKRDSAEADSACSGFDWSHSFFRVTKR